MKKNSIFLLLILLIAGLLRFYNLLFDAPYFFNPDERNMANSIMQMRMPRELRQWPGCLNEQFITPLDNLHLFDQRPQPEADQPLAEDCNLHPHFFAYGQFPLYLSFFSDQTAQRLIAPFSREENLSVSFHPSYTGAIFWLRFWSAAASIGTVFLVYGVAVALFPQRKNSKVLPLLAALIAACIPGLIQSAHFGTTESLLSFFFMASLYLSLSLINSKPEIRNSKFVLRIFYLSLILGLSIGTKLTGIFFFVPPFLTLLLLMIVAVLRSNPKTLLLLWGGAFLLLGGSSIFGVLASPYSLIDFPAFKGSAWGYEKDVAMGTYAAFYTRQFVSTVPVLFQMEKVFPYSVGWTLTILASLGFIVTLLRIAVSPFRSMRKWLGTKRGIPLQEIVIVIAFLCYFIPNAFLFAKWTRFMTPIFPFFIIFAVYAVQYFYDSEHYVQKAYSGKRIAFRNIQIFLSALRVMLYALCILPGLAFMAIYLRSDSRVQATRWIYRNIPDRSYILSETGNVIDIPLGLSGIGEPDSKQYTVISFDFYNLDENQELFPKLVDHLVKADYIFIPSRRIFANYTLLPNRYPRVAAYYKQLFSGRLGFEEIAQFQSFPKLSLGMVAFTFPDEASEETATVFDHPVIRVYRKTQPLTREQYQSLLALKTP